MQIGAAAAIRATETARGGDAAAAGLAFRVPGEAAGNGGAVAAASPARGLDALLALQETAAVAQDPATRDREARRHGRDLLEELAALQKALLAGGDEAGQGALGRLVALLRSMPAAADPGLDGVLRSVGLRARLELARRGLPDVVPGCGAGDAIR
ncbi:MAG: flagellar assembly protein FliX [Janthinobacterium lividum]